jgi:tetratricopeptide (TPR) repeat protein
MAIWFNMIVLKIRYDAYNRLGDTEGAKRALADLVAADPEWASVDLFNHAQELFNTNQIEAAKAVLEELIKIRPDHAEAHYVLGLCLNSSGDLKTAKSHFEKFLELDRYPRATVIEKTCEALDTSDATELHEAYYGCFQGYPFRWFIVLADGRVTHCCYDADCQQPIGDMKTQTIREILASDTITRYMAAFKSKDWQTLARCGECYRSTSGRAAVTDRLMQLGHRLDRVLPVKAVARKLINR